VTARRRRAATHARGAARSFAPAALLVLVGCATQPETRTGFISDYDRLQAAPGSGPLRSWHDPQISRTRFASVHVAPVVWRPATDDAVSAALTPDQARSVTSAFETALREAFASRLPLVDRPGPGTLEVRAAATAVRRPDPVLNIITTAALFVPLVSGGFSAELELRDGATGQVLAAETYAERGGELRLVGNFSETGHARALLSEYAAGVAERALGPAPR
jgi:hypothetical protein